MGQTSLVLDVMKNLEFFCGTQYLNTIETKELLKNLEFFLWNTIPEHYRNKRAPEKSRVFLWNTIPEHYRNKRAPEKSRDFCGTQYLNTIETKELLKNLEFFVEHNT